MTERLTRKERQAHTRSCLLEAAGRVFARRGLASASVDEVAADAGFTKGAVYANFGSKEELFLAMLDARFARRLEELDRAAGRDFVEHLNLDPEWSRLFFEAALHASRDEAFRVEFMARHAAMRTRMAELLRVRAEAAGVQPGVPIDQLVTMLFAMADGVAFERLLDPGAVPDELLPRMLELFTLGAFARDSQAS